ncbi:MAG: Fic family protein [SAR324 cluster bacterium]|nr:Fic family protein [SAR324 cluster bacterium]
MMVIKYLPPKRYLQYDLTQEMFDSLVAAKSGVESLRGLPYQKNWMEPLREMELKHEVEGTTRIEGATFAGDEFEAAFRDETPEEARTRSQQQATAAKKAYRWIETAPLDLPVERAILEIHRLMVTGCDDDHCEPGALRKQDQNVTFGRPPHRGAEGGGEVAKAFKGLTDAAATYFLESEPLLQGLALHYHIAAMHPFQDGNGRCARGVEAYFLRRAGYAIHGFIGLSNYYYEERENYLRILAETRGEEGNLTKFFVFGLKGIALQCARIRNIILRENKIVLFKNMMYRVYKKYETPRRRHINERQIRILDYLMDQKDMKSNIWDTEKFVSPGYQGLRKQRNAFVRDFVDLEFLNAIKILDNEFLIVLNLDWPQFMTDSEFGQKILEKPSKSEMPKLKFR